MRTLVFATNNSHKVREMRALLGDDITVRSLREIGCCGTPAENGTTLAENALSKARYVAERYAVAAFADDTALEVYALDGKPGVHTARYAAVCGEGDDHDDAANRRCLLAQMQGIATRAARFRTVIALVAASEEHLFEGIVEGTIALREEGQGGFGYDSIFIPEGFTTTFATMTEEEKNALSHRSRAAHALANYLSTHVND